MTSSGQVCVSELLLLHGLADDLEAERQFRRLGLVLRRPLQETRKPLRGGAEVGRRVVEPRRQRSRTRITSNSISNKGINQSAEPLGRL